MRKKITLPFYAFLFVFISCQKEDAFPNLDTSPQTEAFKKNKITSYVIHSATGDTITFKDSVLVNANGLPTAYFTTYGMDNRTRTSTTTITYDSLNRMKTLYIKNDFPFTTKMTYWKDDKQKIVFAKAAGGIIHYQFDNDFKRLMRTYVIDSVSPDTVSDFNYAYGDGKLISVSEKSNNKWIQKTEYVYNHQKLKYIKTGSDTSYISQKTGLIDSTSSKKFYKYYK